MKKEIPFITKIDIPYDPKSLEGVLLYRFNNIIEEGFTFSINDFNLFCAILIRKKSLENLLEQFKNYIIQDNLIRPEIQFQKIALAMEAEEYVKEQDLKFYYESRLKIAIERKHIIKKEIQRTGINANKINLENFDKN